MGFEKIDINTYKGGIPQGKDLVIAEEGNEEDTALTLYGFDEVGDLDDDFERPVYGFM